MMQAAIRATAKIVKVATPAMEVTKVEARAAGATSAAGRPAPIRTGDRIEGREQGHSRGSEQIAG